MLPKLLIDDAAANSSPDFAISAVVLTSAIKEVTVTGFHRLSKLKELHTSHPQGTRILVYPTTIGQLCRPVLPPPLPAPLWRLQPTAAAASVAAISIERQTTTTTTTTTATTTTTKSDWAI